MRYIDRAAGSAHIPKLVGSYESELHPWLARISKQPIDTVIDVGAAEGYYAVGLAQMFPNARVIAYEVEADARQLLAKLASINNVDTRLNIRGLCSFEDLEAMPESKAFVMMDVEGAEIELLNPNSRLLRNATILFESHHPRDVIQSKVLDPFSATHEHFRISSVKRSHLDIRHLNIFTRWWIRKVCASWTDERPCLQDWFLLSPKMEMPR